MNRRGFIGSILALASAPAIVRADALMRIVPRELLVAEPMLTTVSMYHGYQQGDVVRIFGLDGSPDGEFRITAVSGNQFSFENGPFNRAPVGTIFTHARATRRSA